MEIVKYSGHHFLVDVPVKVNIWIRPELQKKQFDIIKKARPSILFLQSDGGRNNEEKKVINENREYILKNIDWECTVYKIFEETNNGLYAMGAKVRDIICSTVDRYIALEDDLIPSVSFFNYCAELLEKFKDDQRIECICGFNHVGVSNNVPFDYFYSRQGSIWGCAYWTKKFDRSFDYSDPYTINLLKQRTRHNKIAWKRLNAYLKSSIYENHPAASEFFNELHMYSQNRLQIVPKYNLISNHGSDSLAQHSGVYKDLPKRLKRVFFSETYELSFPLKHNPCVIPDIEYEIIRNRIMGYNTPFARLINFPHRLFISIKKGNYLKRFNKKMASLNTKKEIEK